MIMVTHQMGFAREISIEFAFLMKVKFLNKVHQKSYSVILKMREPKQFLHAVLDAN
jgi:ABC-type polar amino acid transport system ATPase subunit